MNIKPHVLHQIAANYIIGRDVDITIKGNNLQVETFQNLLDVSKKLKIFLEQDKSLEEINKILEEKKSLTKEFQDLTGIEWKL